MKAGLLSPYPNLTVKFYQQKFSLCGSLPILTIAHLSQCLQGINHTEKATAARGFSSEIDQNDEYFLHFNQSLLVFGERLRMPSP